LLAERGAVHVSAAITAMHTHAQAKSTALWTDIAGYMA